MHRCKIVYFFGHPQKTGKITRNKPNFWMYYKADHLIWDLVFAEKKGFFCLFWWQSVFGLCEWMATNLIVNFIVLVKTFLLRFGTTFSVVNWSNRNNTVYHSHINNTTQSIV